MERGGVVKETSLLASKGVSLEANACELCKQLHSMTRMYDNISP